MAHIKGMAILGAIRFVKETAGKERVADLIAELSPVARAAYERPILAGTWYRYPAYRELLTVVTRRLGDGRADFLPSLGRFAARLDVGSVFKIVSVILSPRRALHGAGVLWSRYCDTGSFVMTRIDEGFAEGQIEGFPEISAEHEQLLTGWIEGIGLAAGAKDAQVDLVTSVHQQGALSRYHMRWQS